MLPVGVFVLDMLPVAKAPMIPVVNATNLQAEKEVASVVAAYDKHYRVKSRNVTAGSLDLIIELRTAKGAELIGQIVEAEGVSSASLLSHDGEVTF